MLSLYNIFLSKDKGIYYGILDTESNIIEYLDSYTLKLRLKTDDNYIIDNIKIKELNSVGFGIGNLNIKTLDEIDYDDIKHLKFKNIPIDFKINLGFICYTFKDSSLSGMGWSMQIRNLNNSLLKCVKDNIIVLENETNLLGYGVVAIDNFFQNVTTRTLQKYNFDFSLLRLDTILKINNFFDRCIYQDYIDLKEHTLQNVISINNLFTEECFLNPIKDLQVIDLTNIQLFVLPTTDNLFKGKNRNKLYVLDLNNVFLQDLLKKENAIDLGVYFDDLNSSVEKAKGIIAKGFLLNKPRYDLIFFVRKG